MWEGQARSERLFAAEIDVVRELVDVGRGVIGGMLGQLNTRVPKDDPDWHGPWDCAEFMSWLVFQEAGVLYGCTNNKAKPSEADAYTGAWQSDSQTRGIRISVDEAASTVGAILLRHPPGPGKMGHIVISDGKGGTVEAMGKAFGVRAGTVQGRRWDTGVLVPGIDYGAATAAVTVIAPSHIYAPNIPNMSKAVVAEIQRALAAKDLAEAQKGIVFAAFLKILMPVIVVLPGIAAVLVLPDLSQPDQAYPQLMNLMPSGIKGLIFAALVAAILSSLASMTNSVATIFTMDIYRQLKANATEQHQYGT